LKILTYLRQKKHKADGFLMKVVAIDFETANQNFTSACSLGIAVIEGGRVVKSKEWVIKPVPFYFNYYNTQIHKMTEETCINSPFFNEVFDEVLSYIEGNILCAHNANFDIAVLKSLIKYYNLKPLKLKYFCTCELSKKLFPELYNHRLNTISAHIGVKLNHHNAKSDAIACAEIALYALNNGFDIDSYIKDCDCAKTGEVKIIFNHIKEPVHKEKYASAKNFAPKAGGVLDGRKIAVSGDFKNLSRYEVYEKISSLGAFVQDYVTKDTDFLILSDESVYAYKKWGKMSSKLKKAFSYKDSTGIKILSETEFFNFINSKIS